MDNADWIEPRSYKKERTAKAIKPKDMVKAYQKAFECEHKMEPMFSSHNDSFRGLRCSKCGYAEYA